MHDPHVITAADEVARVFFYRPHVVLLGAGASRATCSNGDANGKRLPLMADLVEVIGLAPTLNHWGIDPNQNFENIFSDLYGSKRFGETSELEEIIEDYFSSLILPDEPTIYDHLLLSLRGTDFIATFNWDPLLLQAYRRNMNVVSLPRLLFLHGNVDVGYCERDRVKGSVGNLCPRCGELLRRAPLLYPIGKKNYAANGLIASEWATLKKALQYAFMITIFGYSGPRTDKEALDVMRRAWGPVHDREMEQTCFITIDDDRQINRTWKPFIHTHHYEIHHEFYDSWIANHPRRSGEAYWNQHYEAKFIEDNPLPADINFPMLHKWFWPLREAEREAEASRRGSKSTNTVATSASTGV